MAKVSQEGKTRNFACVVYEESAPKNWQDILSSKVVPCFISPYHDKDINPDGSQKKPHWHVMIMFDNSKTVKQAREIFDSIGGVGNEIVISRRGYARYLCHLDNPEKAQYSPENVRCLGGADYVYVTELTTDKYKAIAEIMDFCDVNKIYSYQKLLQYCRYERYDWFRTLCDNGSYVVLEYLKSSYWQAQNQDSSVESPVDWWNNEIYSLKK